MANPSPELGPWVPPVEANQLDAQTRARLDELIRELASEQRFEASSDEDAVDVVAEMMYGWLKAAREQADSDG